MTSNTSSRYWHLLLHLEKIPIGICNQHERVEANLRDALQRRPRSLLRCMRLVKTKSLRTRSPPFDAFTRRLDDRHIVVLHSLLCGFDVGHNQSDMGECVRVLRARNVWGWGTSVRALGDVGV